MSKYYSADNILKLKDLDGNVPSIYMVTSNRSAGKTTDLLIRGLKLYKEKQRKTVLIYRYQYELSSASTIFAGVIKLLDVQPLQEITKISHANGLFFEMLIDGESFAYAIALSNVDALKKYSPLFSDVDLCILDEFQKEDGKYLKNEVQKLQSILISIARGGGEQSRDIKCFLLGNNISMLNPYFIFFDVNRRYREDTKFMRGVGWVCEFNENESASTALKKNGLYRAFDSDYMKTSADNKKLFKEDAFIARCSGKSKYLFTIKHDGKMWGVREELNTSTTFVSDKADSTCNNILVFSSGEHSSNTVMLSKHSFIMKKVRESYSLGLLRFSSLNAKNVIYDILALDFSK